MGGLSISLLGPICVTLDGQPVDSFEYNKVRALLAYLVVEPESPHRREALAGLLWPDQSQKAALDSLRNALAKLRQAIGDKNASPPYLIITKDAIQFNRASEYWLDKTHFLHLLEACKMHRHRRIECCSSCAERLLQAAELYQGEFLQGFYLPDSDLFNDWVSLKREKLARLALIALQELASIYEWRGKYSQSLDYTERLLELDPYSEEAYAQAMRLLASLDQRAEACARYKKCHDILEKELGVEPSKETTHLYERIKYGIYQPAPTLDKLRINNLPVNVTSFVGREREIAEINLLVEDPECRLLTLVGPGGVGKTRLARTVAGKQYEAFLHGVCFVPLASVTSIELIIPTILHALGLKQDEQGDLKERLCDYLGDKELMLVLDNFEQLVVGAEIVSELLEKAPGVMILVTSRQHLSLQTEWLFEVNGLSYPAGKAVHNLQAYDSVQLFTARLHQMKTRVTLFEDDLPNVSRICQLVEGLPLGIELAASAARQQTIEQVAKAIESGKEDLAADWLDVPERHRSLRAVFEHSWRLLTQEEQSVFSGLAVFRGGFTAEAARQVAVATPEVLSKLVEQSLIRYNPETQRYNLHELVWQYSNEKLRKQGQEQSVRDLHLEYFVNLGEKIYSNPWLRERCNTLSYDLQNFREAMGHSIVSQHWDLAIQIAGAVGATWIDLLPWQDVYQWLLMSIDSKYEFVHDQRITRALSLAGGLASGLNLTLSDRLLQQSMAICQEIGDNYINAEVLANLSLNAMLKGNYQEAICICEQSLQIYRSLLINKQLNDQGIMIGVIIFLGQLYLKKNEINYQNRAHELFSESLKMSREIGSLLRTAETLHCLGNQENYLGNYAGARKIFEEGLKLLNQGDIPISRQIGILDSLGLSCFYLHEYSAAHYYYERSVEYARNVGGLNLATMCNLSYLASSQHDHHQAFFYMLEVFRNLDNDGEIFSAISDGVLEQLPGVLLAYGEVERAAKLYAFTDSLREKVDAALPPYILPDYERDLADTRRQLGEAAFTAAWEEGRSMTFEQAKACAMEAKVMINETTKFETQI